MAIGTGWAEGSWVDAGWVVGAWSQEPNVIVIAATKGGVSKKQLKERKQRKEDFETYKEDLFSRLFSVQEVIVHEETKEDIVSEVEPTATKVKLFTTPTESQIRSEIELEITNMKYQHAVENVERVRKQLRKAVKKEIQLRKDEEELIMFLLASL